MEPRDRDTLSTSDLAGGAPEARPAQPPTPHREGDPVETRAPAPPSEAPASAPPPPPGHAGAGFMDPERLDEFRARWADVQAGFVDDPRRTVEQADHLVAELFQILARTFADGRTRLEEQWSRGELGTEDLRRLVHRYRALFDTLLRS